MRRGESGDLHVVPHQVLGRGELVDRTIEELLLGVPARPPAQDAADVQVLSQDVPPHVVGLDALGRALVVGAAGRVDVVIARVPLHRRQVDPTLQLEVLAMGRPLGHGHGPLEDAVLGAAGVLDLELSGREEDRLAVGPVDLGVEEEIGGEAAARRRVDAAELVADDERGRRRPTVGVLHPERHGDGRLDREQDVDVAAEPEILAPLPRVEHQLGLAMAGVAAGDLEDAILHRQAGEPPEHGPVVVQGDVAPAIDDVGRLDRLRGLGRARRRRIDRPRVGAVDPQAGRDPGLVADLDEENRPAPLHQHRSRRARGRLHAALRVDLHAHEAAGVQHLLDRPHARVRVRRLDRGFEPGLLTDRQRPAQDLQGLADAASLRGERLELDVLVHRQVVGPPRGGGRQQADHRGDDAYGAAGA